MCRFCSLCQREMAGLQGRDETQRTQSSYPRGGWRRGVVWQIEYPPQKIRAHFSAKSTTLESPSVMPPPVRNVRSWWRLPAATLRQDAAATDISNRRRYNRPPVNHRLCRCEPIRLCRFKLRGKALAAGEGRENSTSQSPAAHASMPLTWPSAREPQGASRG